MSINSGSDQVLSELDILGVLLLKLFADLLSLSFRVLSVGFGFGFGGGLKALVNGILFAGIAFLVLSLFFEQLRRSVDVYFSRAAGNACCGGGEPFSD